MYCSDLRVKDVFDEVVVGLLSVAILVGYLCLSLI